MIGIEALRFLAKFPLQIHAFKAPQGARPSLLGLDKLAVEKRAQAAAVSGRSEPPSKRTKLEADEEENGGAVSGGVFKGKLAPSDLAELL